VENDGSRAQHMRSKRQQAQMNGEKEARRGPIDGREGGIDLCRCSNLDGNGAATAGVVGPVEAAARRRKAVRKGDRGIRRRRRMRGRGQRERRGRGTARGEARLRGWATTAPRRNA